MTEKQLNTICDINAAYLNSNDKHKYEFIQMCHKGDGVNAVRDLTISALSKYGRGEGRVHIATTKMGKIIVGYNEKGTEVLSNKMVPVANVWHTALYSRAFAADIAKSITPELMLSYLGDVGGSAPDVLTKFIEKNFDSLCTVNPSYRRERYNLILSVREYKDLPAELEYDSIAGMNLTVVSEMLLRIAMSVEDVNGDKVIVKKSEIDSNPMIREGAKAAVYKVVKNIINTERKSAKKGE